MKTWNAILLFTLSLCYFHSEAQVVANFQADTTKGCSPVTIQFSDKSTGTGLRYLWSFGNGNVSTKQNPQAIYYLPGKYTVSLEVTNPSGVKDVKIVTQYIVVFKNPIADFSATPRLGCLPLLVNYTNNSTKGDANYKNILWDFGDGNTLDKNNPSHTYLSDGLFEVSLLLTDSNNCQSQEIKSGYIKGERTPSLAFNSDKRFHCTTPLTVQFSDLSSRTVPSDSYLWDFGDGSTSSSQNPQHTYTKGGKFNVKLTISTSSGCNTVLEKKEWIEIAPIIPSFTANKVNLCAPEEATFTNTSSPSGLITKWDFGDGGTGFGNIAKHNYTKLGTYNVTIFVESSPSCKGQYTIPGYINVYEKPKAKFTVNDSTSCQIPFVLRATSTSTNAIYQTWYSDGDTVNLGDFSIKQYTSFGTYKYGLVVETPYGCKDTVFKDIEIAKINVQLSPNIRRGCKDFTVGFDDLTVVGDSIVSRLWTFGDGSSSAGNQKNIIHTYLDTGRFVAKLKVTTLRGCQGEDTVHIRVGQKTNPDYAVNRDSFCNRDELKLTNLTNLKNPLIHSVRWYIFKDTAKMNDPTAYSSLDTLINKVYFGGYSESLKYKTGWYNTALVTEHNGCFDTLIKKNSFYIKDPLVTISSGPFNSCTSDSIVLSDASTGADSIIWIIDSDKRGLDTFFTKTIVIYRHKHGATKILLSGTNFKTMCTDFDKDSVHFEDTFNAQFNIAGELCSPANISFSAHRIDSSEFWYEYNWDLAGREVKNKLAAYRRFDNPGTYNITLVVKHIINKCTDTLVKQVTITGPEVTGKVIYSPSCPPLAVQLKCNQHPAAFDSLYWLIEGRKIMVQDTNMAIDTMFMPGKDSANTSIIRLVGIDSNGCSSFKEFPVKVVGPSSAHIAVSRFIYCDARQFIFKAETPGYDASNFTYLWDLGNGATSTERVLNITYKEAGKYIVKLKLIEKTGCVSTFTEIIDIPNERLQAKFDAKGLDTDCPPLFAQFFDKSTAKNRQVAKRFWDFGDGSTSIEKNPTKLYLKAGKYTVTLYVTDEWGCKDSIVAPDFVIVKGPEGSYTFDKKRGCVPLEVTFNSTTKRTSYYEWDMGDGTVIKNKATFSHIYAIPGRYIPLLILSDSFGCSYTLPPIDTIFVDPYPDPDFTYQSTCVNYPITFNGINNASLGSAEYLWEMYSDSGIDSLYGELVTHTFKDTKVPKIRLTITSSNGCKNSISKNIKLIQLVADFTSENLNNCVGSTINLHNHTKSDTTIIETRWLINDVISFEREPSFVGDKVGPVPIFLYQKNILGCEDSIENIAIVIGDSIKPLNVEMLRVTVNDNETIQVDYKPSFAADFRAYHIYMRNSRGNSSPIYKQTDRNLTSYLATGKNTLTQSYCFRLAVENTCGLMSDTLATPLHCTIETKANGKLNHNLVKWSPYIGWDSVSMYSIYRKELESTESRQFIGTVSGGEYSYIDSALYCNIEYSYLIEATESKGNLQISQSDTANAIPEWAYRPPSNKLVRATVEDDKAVLIEWDSVRNSVIPIVTYVLEKSNDGVNYSKLGEYDNTVYSYLDEKVHVDNQSYLYRTYAIDECDDSTLVWNYGKTILLNVDTSHNQRPKSNWSHYEGWTEPISYYAIEILNKGVFTEIATFPFKDTNFIDMITDLNRRPDYCYRILAYKELLSLENQVVSVSNVDCSPVKSKIFYPNAFSPNADLLNDYYGTPSEYIKEFTIRIYNRWGEQVFESSDLNIKWDGTYEGEPAKMDAYAVIVISTGVDGIRRVHKGTITLVR